MRIGSDHNLHTFLKKEIFNFGKTFKRLQAVRSVASGGKFYRLPPDKENTDSADLVGRCTYMQYGHGELDTTLNFELFLIVSWRFKRKIITTFDNLLAEE